MFFPQDLKIFVCSEPVDMRRSFLGLCGTARDRMDLDPLDGSMFLFFNKRKDMVKVLWYEGDGLAIWMKRLDSGTFRVAFEEENKSQPISSVDLSILIKKILK